jgi:tRNA dimethylallyltransferase
VPGAVFRHWNFVIPSTFDIRALSFMKRPFFIVGPTAVGKSELAADVARNLAAEIISADAFQIYGGLDLLTAKPDAATLAKVPHHLIGTMSVLQERNAAKFRQLALRVIDEIHARGKLAIVVGGSGLYIKALTHGLDAAPPADPELRSELNELTSDQLRERLVDLDPETARKIDMKNRRRVVRALEICLLKDKTVSTQRMQAVAGVVDPGRPRSVPLSGAAPTGIFVFRNRDELRKRINQRVEAMFENGVIGEVRAINEIGATAAKMIGLREIREHLEGKTSILQCVEKIQQATRQYAKRQLTWFRHQTSFEPLNLSLLTHKEAVERVSQRALLPGRAKG